MSDKVLLVNAATRLAYGAGALVSPASMQRMGLAPDVPERADARLFVRAFGGHMVTVGSFGLLAVHRRHGRRAAAAAALAIDLADVASALLEATKRGRLEHDLAGGIAFSAAGALTAAIALR